MSSRILDRFPEIERPLREDGSFAARRKCMRRVVKQRKEIVKVLREVCERKELKVEDVFVFQSTAAGTCKKESDVDIYIQLDLMHTQLVHMLGVLYKDTGVKLIAGEWRERFLADLPDLVEKLRELKVDIFFGVEAIPPAKKEYVGLPYYVNLNEVGMFL